MRLVSVEANIGAGKSTMLPKLVDALNELDDDNVWEQIQEPVDDPMFAELLARFYENPTTENRVKFQFYVTDSRHDLLQELDPSKNYVIERSLYSDVIFCHANFLEMECPEGSYMGYYYYIKKRMETYPQINDLVYLKTDPVAALSRIQSRGRECEQEISLAYLTDLHNFHEACLPQQCRIYGAKMHTFDWTSFGDAKVVAKALLK